MSTLLLIGIVMMGLPALLIAGFATYIFMGFINDDKDARAVFRAACVVMFIGLLLVMGHVVARFVTFT